MCKVVAMRREAVTYNDVLREMPGLTEKPVETIAQMKGWTWTGVFLPDGTELKAQHRGTAHTAKIEDGKWV